MTSTEFSIAYGASSLTFQLPADNVVPCRIENASQPLDRIEERVTQGLRAPQAGPPIEQLYRRGMKVCII